MWGTVVWWLRHVCTRTRPGCDSQPKSLAASRVESAEPKQVRWAMSSAGVGTVTWRVPEWQSGRMGAEASSKLWATLGRIESIVSLCTLFAFNHHCCAYHYHPPIRCAALPWCRLAPAPCDYAYVPLYASLSTGPQIQFHFGPDNIVYCLLIQLIKIKPKNPLNRSRHLPWCAT